VDRWKEDCGCSTGGRAGWNQKWRKPLREALDLLRDELSAVFEREGEKIFKDIWRARNGYIEVILDRSPERVKRFFERAGIKGLDEARRIKGLKLLEMQRHALLMYTSCGCFFADLSGLETIQILQYAARAIELAEALTGQGIEAKFVKKLSEAKSNLPEMGDGGKVYRRIVKPRSVTLDKVVNHFAISSLFAGNGKERKIFSYRVERLNYERMESGDSILVVGQVRVTSEIIPEPKEFFFGLFRSKKEVFRTWVSENKDLLEFDKLREKCFEDLGKSEEGVAKLFSSLLGNRLFTIRETFNEERQVIFQQLIEDELNEHRRIYGELFDRSKEAVEALAREGFEIPFEIRVAAEVTLSHRLLKEVERLKSDDKSTTEKEEIDSIVDEARTFGYHLRMEEPLLILNGMLKEKIAALRTSGGSDLEGQSKRIEEIITFLARVEKWGFEISKQKAQDLMDEMLKEYVGGLEKSWWGSGSEKPFPPNLILLAEKLDFNVERFSKMVNPAASTPRS
jgi:alpha-amylase/alpha-mannosidase (GH57 family)